MSFIVRSIRPLIPRYTTPKPTNVRFFCYHRSYCISIKPHNYEDRNTRLFDLDKLIPGIPINKNDRTWFTNINIAIRTQMNGPAYDASHDYEHIMRVVKETHRIWTAERHHEWARNIDPLVLFVAAIVHDIADLKYASVKTDDGAKQKRECDIVRDFLDDLHCPPAIAEPAAHIASCVSFTHEKHDPARIRAECEAYPALKIVQDADRLDALGSMGIARTAFYCGAREMTANMSILRLVELIDNRFSRYIPLMKTKTGAELAEKRWAVMVAYREALLAQAEIEDVL